jgi:hypothetical protein
MKNKALTNPLKPIMNIFARYNLVMFIIIVVAGLIIAILSLNHILKVPYDSANYTSPVTNTTTASFDTTTIARLNKLMASDNNSSSQTLPSGRINPFFE